MPGEARVTVESEQTPEPTAETTPTREESALQPTEETLLEPKRVIEAALFLANKPLSFAELALFAKCKVKEAGQIAGELAIEYVQRNSSLRILLDNSTAKLEVRPEFLARVAPLSRNVELSKKASRMLALIASKGGMLQAELKKFFRGEIYAYVRELKDHEYVTSEKRGLTRLLKPTKKFHENFQLAQG